jgi:hypothetical protein
MIGFSSVSTILEHFSSQMSEMLKLLTEIHLTLKHIQKDMTPRESSFRPYPFRAVEDSHD